MAVMTTGGECVALRPRLHDGHPPTTTKGQEDPMKRAVTLVAVVLGSLLGITQSGCWCGWVCDVLGDYGARRREQRIPQQEATSNPWHVARSRHLASAGGDNHGE